MSGKTKTISNVRVGRRDVRPDAPAHVPGVRQGNEPGIRKQEGIWLVPGGARASAARSTGIAAKDREPILPGMPTLTPP